MSAEINDLREFGKCRLDLGRKVLWCDGKPVGLPLKAVELLCVLVERGGEVVTKDEIWNEVWQNSFVEESNLTHTIYLLRKSLKEIGEDNLIETVPRRGYRFAGDLRGLEDCEIVIEKHTLTTTSIEINEAEPVALKAGIGRFVSPRFLVLYSLVAFAIILAWTLFRQTPAELNSKNRTGIKSLAVLPLKSFGGDVDESLRLRITDAMITRLGGSGDLIIRPTNAVLPFAGSDRDPLEIGRQLQTEAVLEGRLQQEDGRIRVTLQLLLIDNGSHVWSDQFDGQADQILKLQDAVAAGVFRALNRSRSTGNELTKRPTESSEAYEAYLQGRFFAGKRSGDGLYRATEFFLKAVELDPGFAEAYAGLADTQFLLFEYNYEIRPAQVAQAKQNLQRALELRPELSDALVTLGSIQMNYEWDWGSAEKSFQRSIESSPNLPSARMRYGGLLMRLGRFDESQMQFERALELDPLSIIGLTNIGMLNFCRRDFSAANQFYKRALEINERFSSTHWLYSRSLWLEGKKSESIAEIVKALELDDNAELGGRIADKASVASVDEALKLLLYEWRENPSKTSPHNLAYLSAVTGDPQKAVFWLEKSYEEHHPWTIWVKAAPEFQILRDDPKYLDLVKRMRL